MMAEYFVHVGLGNYVRVSKIIAIASPIISSHLRPLAILKRALPLEFLRKHLEKYEEEEVKEEGRKLRKAIDALEEIERE